MLLGVIDSVNSALDSASLSALERAVVMRSIDHLCEELGSDLFAYYSMRVFDTDWLRERRRIRSFFIQEVDRDKIVLYGDAFDARLFTLAQHAQVAREGAITKR